MNAKKKKIIFIKADLSLIVLKYLIKGGGVKMTG